MLARAGGGIHPPRIDPLTLIPTEEPPIQTLVILAAGLSRRYGQPKPLVPVGPRGEVLIDYSIHDAARAGFRQVVVVTRPELRPRLETHLLRTWGSTLTFRFVYQDLSDVPSRAAIDSNRHAPWGTGHAVLAVRNVIHEPFVVINCDDFYGRDAYSSAADHLDSRTAIHALVGYRLDQTLSPSGGVSRAKCQVGPTGFLERLTEFLEVRQLEDRVIVGETAEAETHNFTGSEIVSMNFWAFQPNIFRVLEQGFAEFLDRSGRDLSAEFFLSSAMNEAIAGQRASVAVLPSSEQWFGMTYQDDLTSVVGSLASLTESGVYPEDIASVTGST